MEIFLTNWKAISKDLEERKQQSVTFTKTFQVSMKSQHASYLVPVAEIIAKNSKPHMEAEKVLFPVCSAIMKTMIGLEAEEKIKQIPLSNYTICRRICDMSTDIQNTVISSVKQSKMFRQWLFHRRRQFAFGIYFVVIIHVCLYSRICYYYASDIVV